MPQSTQNILPKVASLLISVGLVSCLMITILLSQKIDLVKPETLTVRQITMAAPPPPPPPAIQQKNQSESTPSINLSADGSSAVMKFTKVKLPQLAELSELTPPPINNLSTNFLDNLTVDWQAFGLNELDNVPKLLTNLKIKYPTSLVRQGIRTIEVELDVLIDESGNVLLRKIVRNPYPEFDSIIQKLMKKARFTAPKKNGIPVRAAFNWPLEFSHT